jgi:hypothetical protein
MALELLRLWSDEWDMVKGDYEWQITKVMGGIGRSLFQDTVSTFARKNKWKSWRQLTAEEDRN